VAQEEALELLPRPPHRLIVALVIVFWLLSLLAQSDVALRRSGLDGPVLLYAFSLVASDFANPGRMAQYQSFVIRGLSLALSVIVVFYFVVSVVRRFSQVLAIVKLLVAVPEDRNLPADGP
jgi:hypothetical protein